VPDFLPTCLPTFLSNSRVLSFYLSAYLSVLLSVCIIAYLPFSQSLCFSVCLSDVLPSWLPISNATCLHPTKKKTYLIKLHTWMLTFIWGWSEIYFYIPILKVNNIVICSKNKVQIPKIKKLVTLSLVGTKESNLIFS
jgi:hypothetical protein